ncbi:MAG: hypothetical protein JZU70_09600 [Chlorobium sp.]|jgi:hypothetical protein|nr:hypothetical protein [Chlorobium sp.]
MKQADFTPATDQQRFIDAVHSLKAPQRTVAELIEEAERVCFAVDQLMRQGGGDCDAVIDLFHIIHNNLSITAAYINGCDMREMFAPIVQ